MKRGLLACLVVSLAFGQTALKAAEVTRIVVGFPPAQATDIVARIIAKNLEPLLGETVIVENRPGQGGSIALSALTKAKPDGHTLVLAPLASMVVNPHLYKSVGYKTLTDFSLVGRVADLPMVMVVNPSLPVHNIAELVAYAKANPNKLVNSSSGTGTLSHLGMEDFKRRTGTRILHVPYQGSAPAMNDLIAGRVNVAMDTVTVTEGFVKAGKLRAIASAYSERLPAFPNLPTIAEQGYPGFSLAAWLVFVAPAGTPKARIDKLSGEIRQIVKRPEVDAQFAKLGVIPHTTDPAGTTDFVRAEYERWGRVVNAIGLNGH
jgi:tripartite-type tricarboxylate transporter receptor subunit TctC